MRRRLTYAITALGLLILPTAAAFATPRDVVADYFRDGTINSAYSVQDLRGALAFAQRHVKRAPQYSAFADAVNQAITDELVGTGEAAQQQLTTPRNRTEVAPEPIPAITPAPSNLPAPPQGGPADSIPWVVPTMAIIAAILILAGIGSSIWRRVRR